MFEKRYQTRSVATTVHRDIQLMLWSMIDDWKENNQLDYLQVFELSIESIDGKLVQKIIHRQEVPPITEERKFNVVEPMIGRLWVVDSDEGAVMMYPEEY